MDTSDGTSMDERKRKTDEECEGEFFKKSKKLSRTPPRKDKWIQRGKDEDGEEWKDILKQILLEVKEIRVENKVFKEKLEKLENENEKLRSEMKDVKAKMNRMENKMEKYEKDQRKCNLVVKGWSVDGTEEKGIADKMQNFVRSELGVEVKVQHAYKINDKTCIVQTESVEDKVKILKAKNKLRYKHKPEIFIDNDLTENEREIQRLIRKEAAEVRSKGQRTKVGYKKLEIDGKVWKWSEEQRKLVEEEIRGRKN